MVQLNARSGDEHAHQAQVKAWEARKADWKANPGSWDAEACKIGTYQMPQSPEDPHMLDRLITETYDEFERQTAQQSDADIDDTAKQTHIKDAVRTKVSEYKAETQPETRQEMADHAKALLALDNFNGKALTMMGMKPTGKTEGEIWRKTIATVAKWKPLL
jgi:hypothetical protein